MSARHPYVPGQTPRHAEGAFDHLKDARPGDSVDALARSRAWAAGRALLADGQYWEAHEVLESLWLACPQNSAERLGVQAVIQLANAGLKARMGRRGASLRLLRTARALKDEAGMRAADCALMLDPAEWAMAEAAIDAL